MKLDLVVTNARVYTMDPDRPAATRLGIWRGRVAGLDEELEGTGMARVVDAGGRTVQRAEWLYRAGACWTMEWWWLVVRTGPSALARP